MRFTRGLPLTILAAGLVAACTSDNTTTSASTFSTTVTAPDTASDTAGTVSAKGSTTYRVGGTVSGLAGQGLVLDVNGAQVPVTANGAFTAPVALLAGASYAIEIVSQPSGPNQLCLLGGESGRIGKADAKTVTIDCSTDRYVVGGTATGIVGAGVTLQVNGGDDIQVSSNGKFAFPTTLPSGALYTATVKTKPESPSQTCTLTNSAGMVPDASVTTIALTCVIDHFSIGGTMTGLTGTVVLQNNHGDDLTLTTNDPWTFATKVSSDGDYAVTVKTQPAHETCTVTNDANPVHNGPVTNVAVSCVDNRPVPAVCTSGADPVDGALSWVVCAASSSTAIVSMLNDHGGGYHAVQICQQLGYDSVTGRSGTGNHVCGYLQGVTTSCSTPGDLTVGHAPAQTDPAYVDGNTIIWECSR